MMPRTVSLLCWSLIALASTRFVLGLPLCTGAENFGSPWVNDSRLESVLRQNPHLRSGEGAMLLERQKDGSLVYIGVGMAPVDADLTKSASEAERRALLKIVEEIYGASVRSDQLNEFEARTSVNGHREQASVTERLRDVAEIRTRGKLDKVSSIGN
jgi:hypothetical protein